MCVATLHKENWPPQTMAKGVMLLERYGSCSSHLQLESKHGAVRLLAAGASVAAEAASGWGIDLTRRSHMRFKPLCFYHPGEPLLTHGPFQFTVSWDVHWSLFFVENCPFFELKIVPLLGPRNRRHASVTGPSVTGACRLFLGPGNGPVVRIRILHNMSPITFRARVKNIQACLVWLTSC